MPTRRRFMLARSGETRPLPERRRITTAPAPTITRRRMNNGGPPPVPPSLRPSASPIPLRPGHFGMHVLSPNLGNVEVDLLLLADANARSARYNAAQAARPHGTETGRISSGRPNVSNVSRSAAPRASVSAEEAMAARNTLMALGEDVRPRHRPVGYAGLRSAPSSSSERREQIFYVREREILIMFYRVDPDHVVVGIDPELPDGATIVSISHQPTRAAFAFVVSHPSFEMVAPGCEPPVAGMMPFQYRQLTRDADGRYDLESAPLS